MGIVVMVVLLLALVFGPGLWVRRVIERYSDPPDRYAGTGAQLARFLLNKLGMQHVAVESTDQGDHYDPAAKAVRLTPDKYDGRSLTAITVAAHEVGHARRCVVVALSASGLSFNPRYVTDVVFACGK